MYYLHMIKNIHMIKNSKDTKGSPGKSLFHLLRQFSCLKKINVAPFLVKVEVKWSRSVVSNSLRPHRL